MPVVLEAGNFEQWKHGELKDAAALIKPTSEDLFQRSPVSKSVDSSRAKDDDSSLIGIDGRVGTSVEIMLATNVYARELAQSDRNVI